MIAPDFPWNLLQRFLRSRNGQPNPNAMVGDGRLNPMLLAQRSLSKMLMPNTQELHLVQLCLSVLQRGL
jgi:hypothetical protein